MALLHFIKKYFTPRLILYATMTSTGLMMTLLIVFMIHNQTPFLSEKSLWGIFSFGSLLFVMIQFALIVILIHLYSKSKELAIKDELTDIYNRRYFQKMLDLEIKRATRYNRELSLLMIDADHFKKFNDRYGHLVGDKMLIRLAKLLKNNLREMDILARYGGEEFVLLLPDTSLPNAVHVGKKIRRLIKENLKMNSQDSQITPITVSIGVSAFPESAETVKELLHAADQALYKAKEKGRDQVYA